VVRDLSPQRIQAVTSAIDGEAIIANAKNDQRLVELWSRLFRNSLQQAQRDQCGKRKKSRS